VGACIGLVVELLGISTLPFSIGLYLGIATNLAIFAGGALAWLLSRWLKPKDWQEAEARGVLFSSGIIAGDALMGIALAFVAMSGAGAALALREPGEAPWEDAWTLAVYLVLAVCVCLWTLRRDRKISAG
jgi:hypothetical protein